jgi:hypothetical protein
LAHSRTALESFWRDDILRGRPVRAETRSTLIKTLRIAVLAAAATVRSLVFAQDDNRAVGGTGGALGDAAVGAVVGGPVGAVVGAGVGAIVGSSLPAQPSVTYERPVVVGQVLPDTVTAIQCRNSGNTSTLSSTIID